LLLSCVCVYNIKIRIYARRTGCGDVQVNSSRAAATDCYNFRVWPIIIGLNSSHGRLVCVWLTPACAPRQIYMCVCVFFSFYLPLIYIRARVCIRLSVLFPRDLHFKIRMVYIIMRVQYILYACLTRSPRNHCV